MKRRDFLAAGTAALAAPFCIAASPPGEDPVRLANDRWSVEIDPRTLAIRVAPAGTPAIIISRGVPGHLHSDLVRGEASASWTWDGQFHLSCTLAGADLSIAVTATRAGTLAILDQPPLAIGRGLILPIAEGYYIPPDDAAWRAHLAGSECDTTQELSLPLWGLDHGTRSFHWLLTNPFNNLLRFTDEADGLAVGLTHNFTAQAPATPMSMVLHLGPADLLAGAKRYRAHLIESRAYRSLDEKIAATPSAARLIGATHIYLWDNGLIAARDVRDWPGFIARLQGSDPLAIRLRTRFEADMAALIQAPPPRPAAFQRQAIVSAVNQALDGLARAEWQTEEADPHILVAAYRGLREAFVAAFGPALAPDPSLWGGGLSKATFAALEVAGLTRLWIGLGDGWEGGLWRPEAVRAAAERGYLIAPYDSYETAIPPGERPDWATAQLGRAAYEHCAVIRENGTPTSGFQNTGHYTNTICVAPLVRARVSALAEAGGFNSWFLDAFGTGMVFDDYRPGAPMTMAQNAAADIAAPRWISEALQMPTGSEGGNAVCAEGVLFAHGVETPLFGWGDPDLRRDPHSPFYFGNWYPSEAPGVFFRPVALKEPYLSLFFDPRTRLPLCQAAFHGSVIASHQWGFDQLKFANAVADRALIQQLYNTAPMFHLSAGTLEERLPAIRRHGSFFRPVHERLARRTMENFAWLSEDRLVQRTIFADGTQLIANFAATDRRADDLSLPAKSVTAIVRGQPNRTFQA